MKLSFYSDLLERQNNLLCRTSHTSFYSRDTGIVYFRVGYPFLSFYRKRRNEDLNSRDEDRIEAKTEDVIKRVLSKYELTCTEVNEILDALKERLLEETKNSRVSFESPSL